MSFTALNWERDQVVGNGIAKALLHRFADWADAHGECHYGFETIVRKVEFNPRTVAKAIDYLVKGGWLEKHTRTTLRGGCLSPLWRVKMAPANQQEAPCESASPLPCKSAPLPPCKNDQTPPVNLQGNPLRGTNKEESSLRSDSTAREVDLFGEVEPPPPPPVESPPPRPASTPTRTKKPRAAPRHPLPEDWQPDEKRRAFAVEHGRDPERSAEEFRNYSLAKGVLMADWQRAFQNSVLKFEEWDRCPLRKPVNGHASTRWASL